MLGHPLFYFWSWNLIKNSQQKPRCRIFQWRISINWKRWLRIINEFSLNIKSKYQARWGNCTLATPSCPTQHFTSAITLLVRHPFYRDNRMKRTERISNGVFPLSTFVFKNNLFRDSHFRLSHHSLISLWKKQFSFSIYFHFVWNEYDFQVIKHLL